MLNNLIRRLREARHRLAHRLHWQRGYVVSGWSDDALWIGFRCDACGKVTGAHIAETKSGAAPPTVWTR